MSGIGDFMKQQEKDSAERAFRIAMENARNAMRAVKIAIEEGDTDEALRLIDEAFDGQTDLTVSRKCPECGSIDAEWHCAQINSGGVVDGRLRMHDVSTVFYLGCNCCSETIRTVSGGDVAHWLNMTANSRVEGTVMKEDCEQAQDYAGLERMTDDLAALVRRLAQSLRKAAPDNDLPGKALDYLKRNGMQGHPLRGGLRDAREGMSFIKLTDRMPNPEEHPRVLIYTEGSDFAGEQFFDVKAESLNEAYYEDPADQPEVCQHATHWAPRPCDIGSI